MVFHRAITIFLHALRVGASALVISYLAGMTSTKENFIPPGVIFKENESRLSQLGIHRTKDFVFLSIRVPPKKVDKSSVLAIRRYLVERIIEVLPLTERPNSVARAARTIALSYLGSNIQFDGIIEVFRSEINNEPYVVYALPVEKFEAVTITLERVLQHGIDRLLQGQSESIEAMVILELMNVDDVVKVAPRVLDCLTATYGDGIRATCDQSWNTPDGKPIVSGLLGWQASIQSEVETGVALQKILRPLGIAPLENLVELDQSLLLFGHRANDSSLLEHVRGQLNAAGWSRTAALFNVKPVAIPVVVDKPGSFVPLALRAKIAATPAMTFLLLTGGDGAIDFKSQESQLCKDARVAFNKKTPNGILDPTGPPDAAQLLQQDLEAGASYESIILFSATLLALNDPGLAYPLAKISFIHNPAHPYAGVNLLRAACGLDLRQEVKDLLPKVQAQAKLDDWGSRELKKIHSWLTGEQPVATPAPVTLAP